MRIRVLIIINNRYSILIQLNLNKMQSQQKVRIYNQLKQLRQQTLSEYFSSSMTSLANKEVIQDMLKQFLAQNQEEFLTNMANSIAEVKEQYRAVKKQLKEKEEQEGLIRLKIQNQLAQKYDSEMEQFFKKWLQVQQNCYEKSGQKNPLKAIAKLSQQVLNRKNQLQNSQSQLLSQTQMTSQAQAQVKSLKNQIKTLQNRLALTNERQLSKQQLRKSLEQQVYQKHIKLEEITLSYTNLQGKYVNLKEMMGFLENKVCQLKEENLKVKHENEIVKKNVEKSENKYETIVKEKQALIENQIKLNQKLSRLQQQLNTSNTQCTQLKSQLSQSHKQITSLNNKSLQSTFIIQSLSKEKQSLQSKVAQMTLINQELKDNLASSKQECSKLSTMVEEKEQLMRKYLNQKDEQIKSIQLEFKALKSQFEDRQSQEKQFELYLQEITELRQKVKGLMPAKYQPSVEVDLLGRPIKAVNKKSKIFFILTQVKKKLQLLRQEKNQLSKDISKKFSQMKVLQSNTIQLIGAKMIQTKLQCDYCDHLKIPPSPFQKMSMIVKNKGQNKAVLLQANSHKGQYENNQSNNMEEEYQKTREFSYRSPKMTHQKVTSQLVKQNSNPYNQKSNITISTTKDISRNLKKLNQKMKLLNNENSLYQVHLSRVLSQSTLS